MPKATESLSPGKVIFDSLNRDASTIKGTSDGSLFKEEKTMTADRAKLEGTFRLLKHIEYLGMTPLEVIQWCDNKGAVAAT
jgi:hypothetical protein